MIIDIFKEARFGFRYRCRNGKMAIFLYYSRPNASDYSNVYYFLVEGVMEQQSYYKVEYNANGKCIDHMPNPEKGWDIVSRYRYGRRKAK